MALAAMVLGWSLLVFALATMAGRRTTAGSAALLTGAEGEKLACQAWRDAHRALGLDAEIIGGNRLGDVIFWLDTEKTRGVVGQIKTRVLSSPQNYARRSSKTGHGFRVGQAGGAVNFDKLLGYPDMPVILTILCEQPRLHTGQKIHHHQKRKHHPFDPVGYLCDGGVLNTRKITQPQKETIHRRVKPAGAPVGDLRINPKTGTGTKHTMYEGKNKAKLLKLLMKDLYNEVEKNGKWKGACMTLEEAQDQIRDRNLRVEKISFDAYIANINANELGRKVVLAEGHAKFDLVETINGKTTKLQFKPAHPAADGGFRVRLNCLNNSKVATYHKDDADYVVVTLLGSRSRSGVRRGVTDIWIIPMSKLGLLGYVSTRTEGSRRRRDYKGVTFEVFKTGNDHWSAKYHKSV